MIDNDIKKQDILAEDSAKIAYRNIRLADQLAYISKLEQELRLLKASTSWRLTAPLRKLIEIFRG